MSYSRGRAEVGLVLNLLGVCLYGVFWLNALFREDLPFHVANVLVVLLVGFNMFWFHLAMRGDRAGMQRLDVAFVAANLVAFLFTLWYTWVVKTAGPWLIAVRPAWVALIVGAPSLGSLLLAMPILGDKRTEAPD